MGVTWLGLILSCAEAAASHNPARQARMVIVIRLLMVFLLGIGSDKW